MLARMDAAVLAAMARWPEVPEVYGWLRLTARGQWHLRGEPIGNRALREFIGRNYAADARGRWFFQNGPQRAYVSLELAPWVFRVQPDGGLRTHTGHAPQRLLGAALVDGGRIVLQTELGAGNVDDRDAERLLSALVDEQGRGLGDAALERVLAGGLPAFVQAARCGLAGPPPMLQRLDSAGLDAVFGFVREPAAD
jgi:hypothetical protein